MREITLVHNKAVAIIDDEDFELVSPYRWYLMGTSPNSDYVIGRRRKHQEQILMHRLIMNAPDHLEVDHIDHNGLNNRRSNLRLVTRRQNRIHSRKPAGCTSQYKGVVKLIRRSGLIRWQVQGRIGRKNMHLGLFESEIEAAHAYDAWASERFGDLAVLNFAP